ncbi:Hemolymph lipopolysaccharide-binding protein [Zootermopsis nevadensis]|uniref:Hemolymph lipopolysaccharide-binding protein n=3 Tax=Zootermopsis nevadensis TaxID=136037 RepID=A0A067QLC5_ZOONE|nr:Hemolymph lipopolysaccharide-binding protein [Zootermopsis nevadensis]
MEDHIKPVERPMTNKQHCFEISAVQLRKMVRAEGFLCILLWLTSVSASGPESHCVSSKPAGFEFSLKSSRNNTGHWTAQVQLEHGVRHEDNGPWEVSIEHITSKCEDSETVRIEATVIVPPARPGPPQRLRQDYQIIPGHGYYKLHTSGKTWNQAFWTCRDEGTHLVVLNSVEEVSVVKSIWEKTHNFSNIEYKEFIFLGLRRGTDGSFITYTGVPLNETGYQVWAKNEPNNAGGDESCLSMTDTGGLNDAYCERKLAFMCEREL